MITQRKFLIAEQEFERELFGNFDENIKLIEDTLSIDVILREGNIVLMGEEKNVDLAYKLMTELQDTVIKGKSLDKQSVTYSLSLLLEGSEMMIKELDDSSSFNLLNYKSIILLFEELLHHIPIT